jgi:hypothetical protein
MKRRRRRRDDLLDVLLELRAAGERGEPMPPVQHDDPAGTGWTGDPLAVAILVGALLWGGLVFGGWVLHLVGVGRR